jgi:phosphoglycerol transferase MdoB-like AlkP superfamily enzyme
VTAGDPSQTSAETIKQPAEKDERDVSASGPTLEQPAAAASLAQTARTEKRNVVLIHLESTRAQSVTPCCKDIETTPFLDELAKSSLLAEHAYTVVPHTFKASVSVNCGIEPHPVQEHTEAKPNGIPLPCLASLLKHQGYVTVFFQSSTKDLDNFEDLAKNFGYEEFYALESMDTESFQQVSSFSYEDNIMLLRARSGSESIRANRSWPSTGPVQGSTTTSASPIVTVARISQKSTSSTATLIACATKTSS